MFSDLDTPSVLIDMDITENNVIKYQKYCDQNNLELRPHIKTHKIPAIAKLQLSSGAVGITCQKISEAEAMISEGGIEDILITYNILGPTKLFRLRKLADKVNLSVVADNSECIRGLSEAFATASKPLPVLVECDTGSERCGVTSPEAAAELAAEIGGLPGLTFKGLMTYPAAGQGKKIQEFLESAKSLIEDAGQSVLVVSSGGSPDMWKADMVPVATEYRIGTYVYNDRSLQSRGVCDWVDCALTVLATVVSTPTKNRAIIDAGAKVLTSDLFGLTGHGHVLGQPDLKIDNLSEEHGRIISESPTGLFVGQRIRIVPNHACVVTNMLDYVILVRGKKILGPQKIPARGKVW